MDMCDKQAQIKKKMLSPKCTCLFILFSLELLEIYMIRLHMDMCQYLYLYYAFPRLVPLEQHVA